MHPTYWEIVQALVDDDRITKVYLPTNGLLLANADAVARLQRMAHKVLVLLQLDSLERDANMALRAADARKRKLDLVRMLGDAGVFMQLTCTVVRGDNEAHVGAVVDLALDEKHVKVVALQPATWSGRYERDVDPMNRATLSDVVKAVEAQVTSRKVRGDDFVPIPCSHPSCGWITLFFRRFGMAENLTKHVNLEAHMEKVRNKALLSEQELREIVGTTSPSLFDKLKSEIGKRIVRPQDIFTIAVKPFMDRYTYDQDRIATCCHHLMDTRGRATSFCEYNALLRPHDSWDRFPVLGA